MAQMEDNPVKQLSAEWFEARKGRVTGSSAAAVLGISPFATREDVMRRMVRAACGASSEFMGNVATNYGNQNEAGAIYDYEIETCQDVERIGFIELEEWAGCSPDALVGKDGGLEVKSPFGIRNDNPPKFKTLAEQPHYEAQVQFSLFVTGCKWWHFYQHSAYGSKLETIYPDRDWMDKNVPALKQFYSEYLSELASPEDHLAPLRVTIDTPAALLAVAEYDQLSEAIANAEERKKEVLADLVKMGGERDAWVAGRKLTKVQKAGSVSYAKIVKAELPDIDLEPYRGKASEYWKFS